MARYIDADEFYEGFCIYAIGQDKNFIKAVEQVLEDIPTADVVEVKHGRWEKRTFIVFDNEIKDSYHCTECNTTWDTETNYCPNCGAKMDGGKGDG
jgi:rubrerythrin